MKVIIITSIILLVLSCESDNKYVINQKNNFPTEKTLQAQQIKVPPILYFVTQVKVLNDFFITSDFQADTLFQIFTLPDLKYIGGFHHRGKGPKESLKADPVTLRQTTENDFLFVADGVLKYANLNDSDSSYHISGKFHFPANLQYINQTFLIDSTNIYGYDSYENGDKEFLRIKKRDKQSEPFGPEYPKFTNRLLKNRKIFAATKVIAIKPDKTAFAALYDKIKILRIYSKKGHILKEVHFPDSPTPSLSFLNGKMNKKSYKSAFIHYIKIQATSKYIYGMYVGKAMKSIPPGLASLPCEIHVWDWNGNPIIKYSLKEKLYSFDVTKDDKYLIASSLEDIDILYRYVLSHNH